MDYWHSLDVHEHESWEHFLQSEYGPQRLWLFTTHANQSYWEGSFRDGDGLLFGKETAGAPDWLHQSIGEEHRVQIPRFSEDELRSLNLATSVGVAAYEALRQVTNAVN